jgi:heme/copper-type cytochrome/quinol oxidase subunit 3
MTEAAVVHEQFEDVAQQRRSANFGMWIFLGTELMFFGGVFLTFTIYRLLYHDAFAHAARHLDMTMGSINTFVLLTSSFLFSVAVTTFESGKRFLTLLLLGLVLLLGIVFLVGKGFEYYEDWRHGLVPGPAFTYSGSQMLIGRKMLGAVDIGRPFYFFRITRATHCKSGHWYRKAGCTSKLFRADCRSSL